MAQDSIIGIVGSGDLGGAIARGLLDSGFVPPERLWLANRSGNRAGFESWPALNFTTRNQDLAEACGTIVLAVPPHLARSLDLAARDSLVVSVMAGITLAEIEEISGTRRVVRAMSSPAARLRLAYSPWVAGDGVAPGDKRAVQALFEACGETDEIDDEDQIDAFTALTGPVPGFVAFFAEAMVSYAIAQGVAPSVAERAIRQLFYASGTILRDGADGPGEQVQAMIDYAGTTAAGLTAMRDSELADLIHRGLDAARDKARRIAQEG